MSTRSLLASTGNVTYRRETCHNLLEYAKENRDDGIFNDVTVHAGHITIGANRVVLSCYSTFFEKMFKSQMKERYEPSITIKEIDATAVKLLIDFIYEGSITVDSTNVIDILSAADFLQLTEVKLFCLEFLEDRISLDNWHDVFSAAKAFESYQLLEHSYQFILNHWDETIQSTVFKIFTTQDIILLILNARESENTIDETALCKFLINWTKQDEEARMPAFGDLFQMIELKTIPFQMLQHLLTETLIKNDVFLANTVINKLFNLLKEKEKKCKKEEKEIQSSKIICVGGTATKNKVIEVFNMFNAPKQTYPDLPYNEGLIDHSALKLNDAVFCIGGHSNGTTNKVYQMQLNESNLRWKEVAPMNNKRRSMGTAVLNGYIVVAGGYSDRLKTTSTEYCDDPTSKWQMGPRLQEVREDGALVACGDSLFIVGGFNDRNYLSSVERLRSLDGEWESVAPMLKPRYGLGAVSLNGYVYAIGGRSAQPLCGSTENTVERFDLSLNEWSYVCEMKYSRSYLSACVFQGKIFVIGGIDNFGKVIKEIEVYDPKKDEWFVSQLSEHSFNDAVAISI